MSLNEKIETRVKQVQQTSIVGKAIELLRGRSGLNTISAISFLESAFPLPILTDPFLIAAILAERKNAFKLILFTTITSVLGGIFAYLVALFFFDTLSNWMSPEITKQFNDLIESNDGNIFVLTLVGAITPIPYTVVAWVVAFLNGGLLAFITASVIGRGLRYSIVGFCAYYFGPQAIPYIKKYLGTLSILVVILAITLLYFKM